MSTMVGSECKKLGGPVLLINKKNSLSNLSGIQTHFKVIIIKPQNRT